MLEKGMKIICLLIQLYNTTVLEFNVFDKSTKYLYAILGPIVTLT
jgi:hypothetical protein